MKNENKLNLLDEALRISWLEKLKETDSRTLENELNTILSGNYLSKMDNHKEKMLIDKLFTTVTTNSLGKLISEKLEAKTLSNETIADKSKLPLNVVMKLKSDEIFPNNVPIILFKNLLKELEISFRTVKSSIWKTYAIIRKRELDSANLENLQPSFRRGSFDRASSIKLKRTERNEFFENEEALQKYISKLEGLMK